MSINERSKHRARLLVTTMFALAIWSLHGCATSAQPSTLPAFSRGVDSDTSLFASVIRAFPARDDQHLWIDPRPYIAEPDLVWTHDDDLAVVGDSLLSARTALLNRLGIAQLRDVQRCERGSGGLARVPDSAAEIATRSALRPFCLLVALPREGGVHFPPGHMDARDKAPPGAWTTRVITVSPSGRAVYDVVAVRGAPHGWTVVQKVLLWSAFS